MRYPIYTAVLALVWMTLNERFTIGDFLIGYGAGMLILYLHQAFWNERVRVVQPGTAIRLLGVFLWEVVKANVQVARLVVDPRIPITPAFIAIPLTLKDDFTITVLANMITLTPGTLTVDVADDRSVLYVHCLSTDDVEAVRKQIKRDFEHPLNEAIRCSPL